MFVVCFVRKVVYQKANNWASCLGSQQEQQGNTSGMQAGQLCSRDSNKAKETGSEE